MERPRLLRTLVGAVFVHAVIALIFGTYVMIEADTIAERDKEDAIEEAQEKRDEQEEEEESTTTTTSTTTSTSTPSGPTTAGPATTTTAPADSTDDAATDDTATDGTAADDGDEIEVEETLSAGAYRILAGIAIAAALVTAWLGRQLYRRDNRARIPLMLVLAAMVLVGALGIFSMLTLLLALFAIYTLQFDKTVRPWLAGIDPGADREAEPDGEPDREPDDKDDEAH